MATDTAAVGKNPFMVVDDAKLNTALYIEHHPIGAGATSLGVDMQP